MTNIHAAYEDALLWNDLGYSIAGFVEDIFEGAKVLLPTPDEGTEKPCWIEGRVLHVRRLKLADYDMRSFVIEEHETRTQVPLVMPIGRIIFFKLPKEFQ